MSSYEELVAKYKQRMQQELGAEVRYTPHVVSREYTAFKEELYPTHLNIYEKTCNFAEKLLKLKPSEETSKKLQQHIDVCHLNITPSGVLSFAIAVPLLFILLGSFLAFFVFNLDIIFGGATRDATVGVVYFVVLVGLLFMYLSKKLPEFLSNNWRMKASNQMVQCIFYVVTYMRHTSNLERAIEFASEHVTPPLSLDLKKILWDIETGKYGMLKDSLNSYLEGWKEWNKEFVESFHLIESSLYEPSETARLAMLDKALDVMLTETYERMLHYAHNLKSPMTMLHMLGVILPILGLVILPLAVSFLAGGGEGGGPPPFVMATYIALLYNVILPIGVYYMGKIILSKRPTGYGDTDITEVDPGIKKHSNVVVPLGKVHFVINPIFFSIAVFGVLFLIGTLPLVLHTVDPSFDFSFGEDDQFQFAGYICPAGKPGCAAEDKIGPYGLGASLLSIVVVLGIGAAVGLYFALRSKNVIKIRESTKKLEDEFSSSLFQLGNRLGDGLPAEIAFARVGESMKETTSGHFFQIVERNISQLGMGIERAIFDKKVGALTYFPSRVIESSMKVLIESAKKGPRIAAEALLSMSRYIKEIHRVDERLKDLMADVISSMTSQIKFLTPAIAGIVVGITSMISTILTQLAAQLAQFAEGAGAEAAQAGGAGGILDIFGTGIPTFYFQIIVGIYVIQITYILTVLANGIENGADKLGERYLIGKNVLNSTMLYCIITLVVMLLFNFFAVNVLPPVGG